MQQKCKDWLHLDSCLALHTQAGPSVYQLQPSPAVPPLTERPVCINTGVNEGQVRLNVRVRSRCAGRCGAQLTGNVRKN